MFKNKLVAGIDFSIRLFAISSEVFAISSEDALTFQQVILPAQLNYFSSLAGAKSIVNDWVGVAPPSDKAVDTSPMSV
ncbi:MAG: hypothetical protein ACK5TC_02245 [bacterium]